MNKIIKISLIILVILIIIFFLAKNIIIKNGVEIAVKKAVCLNLEIDELDIGILDSKIKIAGLNIHNPEGFNEKYLAKIPLIYVDYELVSLLKKKFHSTKIELNIDDIVFEKNSNNEINLNKLKAVAEPSKEKSTQQTKKDDIQQKKQEKTKKLEVQIDELILTANQLRFVTYRNDKPKIKTLKIGLDHEKFENIKSIRDIIRIVMLKTLMATGLSKIGVGLNKLAGELSHIEGTGMESIQDQIKSAGTKLKGTKRKAKRFLKNIFNK